MTFAVLALMSGLLQINPVWNIGPYNPSQVSAGSQPDFYMMWTDGLARIWPAWELYLFGRYTIPQPFWIALLMGLVFTVLILYPWIEKKFSKDDAHHNLLQRPRDVPVRTGLGAMALGFYTVATLMCINDLIAYKFDISINATTWMGRIGLVIVPPLAYFIAYRFCLGLQRSDRQVLEHGIETGIIRRLPDGEYIEIHQPLGPVDDHGHPLPLDYQGATVPKRMNRLGSAGKPGLGSWWSADPADEAAALEAAHHESEAELRTILKEYQDRVHSEADGEDSKALSDRDGNGETH